MQTIENRRHRRRVEQVKFVFQADDGLIAEFVEFRYNIAEHMPGSGMQRCTIRPVGITDKTGGIIQPRHNSGCGKIRL